MQERIDRLLAEAGRLGAQAALLHSPENIRYFSGFTGEGCVFLARGMRVVLTDFRYTEQAVAQAPGYEVRELAPDKSVSVLAELAAGAGAHAVAYEDDFLPVSQYNAVAAAMKGVALISLAGAGVKLRAVKDEAELALMKRAGEITDALFRYALTIAKPGVTELDIVAELEYQLAKKYQAKPAFPFIVAAGENGSMPHAIPSRRAIRAGDMVTLDFGAEYMGYKADMTRTFAVGKPSQKMAEIYAIVLAAHWKAADVLKPGAVCSAVDALARGHIRDAGYGENFGHGLGHGVGLQIHEQPGLNARCDTVLEAGMVVTDEPGIYLPGIGGVRIEDTCIITPTGWESLFTATKDLVIL